MTIGRNPYPGGPLGGIVGRPTYTGTSNGTMLHQEPVEIERGARLFAKIARLKFWAINNGRKSGVLIQILAPALQACNRGVLGIKKSVAEEHRMRDRRKKTGERITGASLTATPKGVVLSHFIVDAGFSL